MNIPVKKNKEYIVNIIDYGYEGEGIAKIDGYTIFIPGAMKDEKIKILIVKVNSSHAFGKILQIIQPSQYRVSTDCVTYQRCGGCSLRHITYENTLKIKKEKVQNLVNKTLVNKIVVEDTIGMKNPSHYRNKAQYPVGMDKDGNYVVGVYANRTHEIIPIQTCFIQNPISEKIAKFILNYIEKNRISVYNEQTQIGIFRHIVIRIGVQTNEIMCILVINAKSFKQEKDLTKQLIETFPKIKTIVKNINLKNTNVILGDENKLLYGDGYIYDKLGDYSFKISPMSFYQVNPIQTQVLYDLAIKQANLIGQEVVFDLYCGIGTIGIFASKYAKKVYGIEIINQAIEDAKENAKINKIDNIEFFCRRCGKDIRRFNFNKKTNS